jgi:putative flippase GtrA
MLGYTREKIFVLLKIDFIRFCIVGGLGFLINLAILATLHSILDFHVFVSQLIAAEVALFCNFALHHHWTYKKKRVIKTKTKLLVQFHASSWPAILGSASLVSLGVGLLHLSDLFALIFSSVIALGWNFAWSKYVIWKDVSEQETAKNAD